MIDHRWEGWGAVKSHMDVAFRLCAERATMLGGRHILVQVISGGNNSIPFHGSAAFRLRDDTADDEIILALGYAFDATPDRRLRVSASFGIEEGIDLEDPELASMTEIEFADAPDDKAIAEIQSAVTHLEAFIDAQARVIGHVLGKRNDER